MNETATSRTAALVDRLRKEGQEEARLTFGPPLGPPSAWDRSDAIRSFVEHHVVGGLILWLEDLLAAAATFLDSDALATHQPEEWWGAEDHTAAAKALGDIIEQITKPAEMPGSYVIVSPPGDEVLLCREVRDQPPTPSAPPDLIAPKSVARSYEGQSPEPGRLTLEVVQAWPRETVTGHDSTPAFRATFESLLEDSGELQVFKFVKPTDHEPTIIRFGGAIATDRDVRSLTVAYLRRTSVDA